MWSEEVRARLDQASRGRAELRFCLPVQASDLQAALVEIERLRAMSAWIEEIAARVEKVLALHASKADEFGPVCSECDKQSDYGVAWSCPTIRALNGEKVLIVLEEHGTAGCPGCAECGGK